MQSSSVLMPAWSQLQPNVGALADDRRIGFLHRST
jgi:hypothetical protein